MAQGDFKEGPDFTAQERRESLAQRWLASAALADVAQVICSGQPLSETQMRRLQDSMKVDSQILLRGCFFTIYAPPGSEFEQIGLKILARVPQTVAIVSCQNPIDSRRRLTAIFNPLIAALKERGDKDVALAEITGIRDRLEDAGNAMTRLLGSLGIRPDSQP